jgi:hypothetical protein
MTRKPKAKGSGALDRIGERLGELPPARRRAIEMELARIEKRAGYAGAKRGPKAKLGETMSKVAVVKATPDLMAEFRTAAKALGFDNLGDYFRELHRRHAERRPGEKG